ncbi:MAG: glycosyltransferase family 4 protein [Flavobacteriia bacterium]|nr:glycosyltransferase family 4 protein [Flavobacteriia bacterium]
MSSKKVIFVGSFLDKSKTGGVGGQMFACKSLVESDISNEVEWLKIDSTAESNLKIPLRKRVLRALSRIFKLLKLLLFNSPSTAILFSSNGFSFLEKGTMVLIIKFLRPKVKVILAPRSGRIKAELKGKRLKFAQKVFNKSDIIICQGDSWKQFFTAEVCPDPKKYVTIKNWINTELYGGEKEANNLIEILFLAWLEIDKGLLDLIHSVDQLIQEGHSFKLRIAGKGKHEEEARALVAELNLESTVIFEGWVLGEMKHNLLNNSDIFVLPSYFEGSPNALLEAMASSCACVSTTVGAIPDIIENGKNGFIGEAGDVESLIKHLRMLLLDDELRTRIASQAMLDVQRNHSIESATTKFKEII